MNDEITNLKKIIRYRSLYSGTKETDIIYKRIIIDKLENLNKEELLLLSSLFNEISDNVIFNLLIKKSKPSIKYQDLINKLKNKIIILEFKIQNLENDLEASTKRNLILSDEIKDKKISTLNNE
jgi:succinate dehydrogenase flavin-adding protein (antitoxin of CptAB toxin-antitoxin module)